MSYPECFIPKCAGCEYKAFCARAVGPVIPLVKPAPSSITPSMKVRGRPRGRAGKKFKDMTHEERKTYAREGYNKRKAALKKKSEEISGDEKLGRMQKLQDRIDKVKEGQNNLVPERP